MNCTNGTINWKQIYGEEAFRLKSPVYESDYVKLRKGKEVDLEDLGKRAQQYAKVQCRQACGCSVASPFIGLGFKRLKSLGLRGSMRPALSVYLMSV